MRWADLGDRRVAILGFGLEGQAVLRALRKRYPRLPVGIFDERPEVQVVDEFVTVHTGPLDTDELAAYDVGLRSPGISPYRSEFARSPGLRLVSPTTLWFAEHGGERTICITGTKGKSTTASLTAHLLRRAGAQVVCAGNLGRPLWDCEAERPDWWVIELSSYQLADLDAAPAIAAITNLSPEHLDWHGSFERYRRDKLRLARLVTGGILVVNRADPALDEIQGRHVREYGTAATWHVREHALHRGDQLVIEAREAPLAGDHNLLNIAGALTIAEAAGVQVDRPARALSDFRGLPHRLEKLGVRNDVTYVNDSLATTPVATLAALQAYRDMPVVLIVGGLDRGVDWAAAAGAMRQRPPAAVICLPDNGPAIGRTLQEAGVNCERGIHEAEDLAEAMQSASRLSRPGDAVLLSPGAPSFPQFQNYADRGNRFAQLAGFKCQ